MNGAVRFPFLPMTATGTGASVFMPLCPLELLRPDGQSIKVHGLLDTGATVNVLPFTFGLHAGAVWERQHRVIPLAGNLAGQEARALMLEARIGEFAPVRLAFAWTRSDEVPLLLGQVNFFREFDTCFYAARREFELRPASTY
jgi:hypothetical protein